jgi:hypothetical protein
MDSKEALVVFEGTKIRRTWHDEQWYFSVFDIIQILIDSGSPRQYWGVLKSRETRLLTICLQLKLPSADGKSFKTDSFNIKYMFRIIHSIMSLNRLTQELTERLTHDYWNKVLNRTIKSYR